MNTLPPSLIALPAASQATGSESQPLPLPIPGLPQPAATTTPSNTDPSSPNSPAPQGFSEVFAGVMLVQPATLDAEPTPEEPQQPPSLTPFTPDTHTESQEDPQEPIRSSLHPHPIQVPVYHLPTEELVEPPLTSTPAIPEEELVDPSELTTERRIVPVDFNRTTDPEDPDPFGQSNRTSSPVATPPPPHSPSPHNTGGPAEPRTHSSPLPPRTHRNHPHTPPPPVSTEPAAPEASSPQPVPINPPEGASPPQASAPNASAPQPESAHPDPPAAAPTLDPSQTPAPRPDAAPANPPLSPPPLTRAPLSPGAPESGRIPVPTRPTAPSAPALPPGSQPQALPPNPSPTRTAGPADTLSRTIAPASDPNPQPDAVPPHSGSARPTPTARSNAAAPATSGNPTRPVIIPPGFDATETTATDAGTSEPIPANPTAPTFSPSRPMPTPATALASTPPPLTDIAPTPGGTAAPAHLTLSPSPSAHGESALQSQEQIPPHTSPAPEPTATLDDGRIRVPSRTPPAQTANASAAPRNSLELPEVEVHSLSTRPGDPTSSPTLPETPTRARAPRRPDPTNAPQRPGTRASIAMSMTSSAPALGLVGDSRHVLVPDETLQRSTHPQPPGTTGRPSATQPSMTQAPAAPTSGKPLEPARLTINLPEGSSPIQGPARVGTSVPTASVAPEASDLTLRKGQQPRPSVPPASAAPAQVIQGQMPAAASLQSTLPTPPAPLESQPALSQIRTRMTLTSAGYLSDTPLPARTTPERGARPAVPHATSSAGDQGLTNRTEPSSPVYLSAAQIGWTQPGPLPLATTLATGNAPEPAQGIDTPKSGTQPEAGNRNLASAGGQNHPASTTPGLSPSPVPVPPPSSPALHPTLAAAQTNLTHPTPVEIATGLGDAGIAVGDQDKRNPNTASINTLERQKASNSTTDPRDGTPVAPQGSEMKNGAFMDNSAGGGRQEEARFLAYRSSHSRGIRTVGAAGEPTDASTAANSAPTSAILNVPERVEVVVPTPAQRGVAVLDRIVQMMDREIQVMRQLSPESMAVTVRPDAHTSIFLELHQQDGQITARARLEQGDIQSLRDAWPELQRLMAARGVELAPVEDRSRPAISNSNPDFQGGATADHGQTNGRRSREQEPRTLDQLPLVGSLTEPPKKGARLRKSDGKHLLESWA